MVYHYLYLCRSGVPAVQQQSPAGLSHGRYELVHDAAGHPGEGVFCLLTRQGLVPVTGLVTTQSLGEEVKEKTSYCHTITYNQQNCVYCHK